MTTKRYKNYRETRIEADEAFIEYDTASELAVRVLKGEGLRATTQKHKRRDGPNSQNGPSISVAEAAVANGMSERAYKRLRSVERNGVPELVQAVKDKLLKVSTAERLTYLPEDEQREQLALHIEAHGRKARDPDKITARQWSSKIFGLYREGLHPKFQELMDTKPPEHVCVWLKNMDAALQRLLNPI